MTEKEKKYLNGLLNADDDFSLVAPNEVINGKNLRFGSTDDGATGRWEFIKGNVLHHSVTDASVSGHTLLNRGSVEDKARNRAIYLDFNQTDSAYNRIYCYDRDSDLTYIVLKEEQVTEGLGITEDKYIDAARVWGDLLIYTTGTGEVRCINIESGIKLNHPSYTTTVTAYTSPLKQEDVCLIKRPPIYAPTVTRKYDAAYTVSSTGTESWQFNYIYQYADFQESVVGMWSLLVPYNRNGENYNYVKIELPFDEDIPQTVKRVKLVAKKLSSNTFDVVKIWDKDVAAEATEITNHNSTTTKLTYNFYNDLSLYSLSDAQVAKVEDLVPKDVQTLEVNTDRLFLSDYSTGFSGKTLSSLTINQVTQNFHDITPNTYQMYQVTARFYMDSGGGTLYYFRGFYVHDTVSAQQGYYLVNSGWMISSSGYPTNPAPTSPITKYLFSGTTLDGTVLQFLYGNQISLVEFVELPGFTTVTEVSIASIDLPLIFKSNSIRQVGICFYDKFKRIIQAIALKENVFTPASTFGSVNEYKTTGVECTVSNSNALNEIPDDAYYYSFVLGENKVTRSFIELSSKTLRYGKKNTDGTYTVNLTATSGSEFLVIDIGSLTKNGIGYTFTEGDLCRIGIQMTSSSVMVSKTIKVVLQIGKNVLCEFVDLGSVATDAYIANFEIYTPYKQTGEGFLYEVGNIFPVTNPTLNTRAYSTLTYTITGDTPFIKRLDSAGNYYYVEAMSTNDIYWSRWFTNSGRATATTKPRKIYQTSYVTWSGQYFIGTELNSINTFEINNNQQLSIEAGAVIKLQNASRLQAEGGVMLALCERETLSLYVGRAQISDENQFNILLKTDTVIGTVNGLRGSLGCVNPESVVFYKGNVYWFDMTNGVFASYSSNGLFPISENKLRRVSKLLAEGMKANESSVTDFPQFIPAGVDLKHDEVLWSVPATSSTAPKGQLPDYSIDYPYDIHDGTAKVFVYKIKADRFSLPHNYSAEGFVNIGNDLCAFKRGKLYKHNEGNLNEFFGDSSNGDIAFVINQNTSQVKIFKVISVESTLVPSWTHFRTEWPVEQSTEVLDSEWTEKEGVWYANLFRDRLSPNVSGSYDVKMLNGDEMRGQYLLVNMSFSPTQQMSLRFQTINYINSYGHKN